jgi:PIN domain nuclease of toxin-antitoxin system
MLYIDTHVAVWLYSGMLDSFSKHALKLIEENDLIVSPMVTLELTYLYETKKITRTSQVIVHELESKIGLKVCDTPFDLVVNKAQHLNWTRDPFDRLIVANAISNQSKLLTKDKTIRKHYKSAVWD